MAQGGGPRHSGENYIVEFLQVGNAVKVSAVDPATGTEVSVVGSPLMSRDQMARTAIQKLEYRLRQRGK
jgi:hypothetical protein